MRFGAKPGQPVPLSPAVQAVQPVQPVQPVQSGSAGIGVQEQGPLPNKAPSNARFRSFAERWVVERARHFTEATITVDTWTAVQQAKTAYNMIKEVGRNLTDDT